MDLSSSGSRVYRDEEVDSSMKAGATNIVDDSETSRPHPTSLAGLCPLEESRSIVNIICVWHAIGCHGERVVGLHQVLQLPVRPRTKMLQGCPLTITAKHKSKVMHDFSRCPLVCQYRLRCCADTTSINEFVIDIFLTPSFLPYAFICVLY